MSQPGSRVHAGAFAESCIRSCVLFAHNYYAGRATIEGSKKQKPGWRLACCQIDLGDGGRWIWQGGRDIFSRA